ncbi:uncharacterized protein [Rutidosis leptorrhynchoides]|uniref:uncharacterized protein isoform X3 n=1 Tax=Rutidosis leptorrhynchoides TaxID=125765 RepID=UPI003A99D134
METSTLEGSNVEMFSQKSLIYILVWKTYLLRFCWSFSFKGEHLFSNMKEVDACISSVVSATSQGVKLYLETFSKVQHMLQQPPQHQ